MGSGLEPQEELQRPNQDRGNPAGGEKKARGGDLGDEKRPRKREGSRKLERQGAHSFHVRSRKESASPLPWAA